MIHFERSFDYPLIRHIMTHPKIYPHITDDYSPPISEYHPIQNEYMWYVIVHDIYVVDVGPEEILGLWVLHPHNTICWEIHTCLLPNAWGPRGQVAARLLPEWIWQNTTCRRIITAVPTTNRLALHFAFKAGMKAYGVNEASYFKNDRLCDQVVLGISAPAEYAPHSRSEAQEFIAAYVREGDRICQ